MRRLRLSASVLALLAGPAAANAAGCSPGVGPSCVGDVLQTTQPMKFGARRPAIVKLGKPVPEGTTYCFVGESRIGRKLFLYVDRSEVMIDGADVKLPTGCKLDDLDTSEPD